MHVSVDLLLDVARGALPLEMLAEVEADHVRDLCPECRSEWRAARAEAAPRREPFAPPAAPHPPLSEPAAEDRFVSLADYDERRARISVQRHELRKAREDLSNLLKLPPEDWRDRIASGQSRCRSRAFAELLLAEARSRASSEPELAGRLAALVPDVLHWMPQTTEGWPRALAHRAGSLRAEVVDRA